MLHPMRTYIPNISRVKQCTLRFYATKMTQDPQYKGLFYHPTKDSKFAVSFLDFDKEKAIIGWVPEDCVGKLEKKPDAFVTNTKFQELLHQVIKDNAHIVDKTLIALAKHQKQGWLHIADERNPPPWGRIPSPEDIFGSVNVIDGKIVEGSYQRMLAHRIVSSNGLFKLSDPLHQRLVQILKS
ncbi:hypothetical protein K7432_009223 [Basidiobolus ranarum]|uniref:Uncharacterized protein n=1 Tax=Basidiobolus ranarum TaxID=34480 RepID=A0ABR2VXW2_9FUNG